MQEHPYQLHGQPCPRRAARIAFTALLSGPCREDAPRVVYSCLSRCCGYVPVLQKTVPNEEKLKTEDLQARAVPPLELPLTIKAGGLGGRADNGTLRSLSRIR